MAGGVTLDPGYTIAFDLALDVLSVQPTGLWDMAMLTRYGAAYDAAVGEFRGRSYCLLVDMRGFAVQGKLFNAAAQHFVARQNPLRTALVLSNSVLQRMQAQRMADASKAMRVFAADQVADARRWLLEPVAARVACVSA